MVRGERDQAQGDLRSRFCYLPAALTKMRDTLESVQLFAHACTNPAQKRPVLGSMMELRNQEFESTPLQRRVCEPSVPQSRSAEPDRGAGRLSENGVAARAALGAAAATPYYYPYYPQPYYPSHCGPPYSPPYPADCPNPY